MANCSVCGTEVSDNSMYNYMLTSKDHKPKCDQHTDDGYNRDSTFRRTWDINPYAEEIDDYRVHIRFIYSGRVRANSRRVLQRMWQDFDAEVTKALAALEKAGIRIQNRYSESWYTIINESHLNQWNGEDIDFQDIEDRDAFVEWLVISEGYTRW